LIPGQYLKITAAAAGDTIRRITNIIKLGTTQDDTRTRPTIAHGETSRP
jgi:hypothetical protein